MTDSEIIEELARAACAAEGLNPDEWHRFVNTARQFLAMQRFYNTYLKFDGLKP